MTRIARKEFASFFASLTAFLFFGAFLFITLFVFFWVDTFFARNICDVRPMFEWMPALLILLVPAMTMRMWSEERRSGTLELLMTAPASNLHLVLGKFIACIGLVAVALALTLPIPVTVDLLGLGQLDLGPVVGGYVASLFLAGAYTAIGLYVSARTDNQIVSLLFSIFLCGLFLLVGSDPVVSLFSTEISEILKLIGTGSRFQSITRGVIDFRDLYYYISIMGVFLSLNVLQLERLRWAGNPTNSRHKQWLLISALCIANFIAGNFWLQQVGWARVDITEGQSYTISDTTRKYIAELKEPLLIRGYFSKKTHPLLAPLVPQLRDLMKEYAVVGNGKVRVEFIDPLDNPDLEREAGEKFGIKPVAFQTANKYQVAVENSYFDVLVKYGDQHETLSFRDLIEVKMHGESDLEVELRNPEYDITSAIKKVLSTYRAEGNLFQDIKEPVTLKAYISNDDKLPAPLRKLKNELMTGILEKLKKDSQGKLIVESVEPEANEKTIEMLQTKYAFRPMAVSILDPRPFWFYMVLESGGQTVPVQIPEDFEKLSLETNVKAGLKKFSRGFLKTIGLWTEQPDVPMFAIQNSKSKHFSALRERLGSEYAVKSINFENAKVPDEIDILLVLAPEKFDEKRVFAMDQFLMRGGTIIAATSPFDVDFEKDLEGHKLDSGLVDWLKGYGINLEDTMVLDPQNSPFPIPVERKIEDYVIQETKKVPYPYFVDVRQAGMDQKSGITSGVSQVTVNWPSPVSLDEEKNKGRTVIKILNSSKDSWTSPNTDIQPDFESHAPLGFATGAEKGSKTIAVAVEGQFESYFKGKKPPTVDAQKKLYTRPEDQPKNDPHREVQVVLDKSPASSRIILFASNSFLSDEMLELASATQGTAMLSPITLISNSIDWSLGERDLLSIRGRAHFSRQILPLDGTLQLFFEYLNYGLALGGLFVAWVVRSIYASRARKRYKRILGLPTGSPKTETAGSAKS